MPDTKSSITFTPVTDPIYVHVLTKPVTYGASTLAEIPFRRPNGRDLLYIGSPVIADPTSGKEASLDYPKVFALAQALSGLPEKIFIEQVAPVDIVDLGWKLGSFFYSGVRGSLAGDEESEGSLVRAARAARHLARVYPGTSVFELMAMPEGALWRLYQDTAEDLRRERR